MGVVTAAGFALRLEGLEESLFGDELFAYDEVHGHSLGQVLHDVTGGQENSPPLYFVLAWAAIKLGDPTALIRLPSLVSGPPTYHSSTCWAGEPWAAPRV